MGKAKDGSECYTRQNKSGGNYVTCEGSQNKRKARRALVKGGEAPVMTKKPKADSAREKGKRKAKARKLTTRPPGRIDTNAPRNVGIVAPRGEPKSKPPPKPKPKAKASGKNQVSIKLGKRTISWTVPKHTVNQSDSLKVLENVAKNFTYRNDLYPLPDKRDTERYSNDKPYVIDARIEGNKLKYKELDIPASTAKNPDDIKYRARTKTIKPKK